LISEPLVKYKVSAIGESAASLTRHSPAASALPLTKVALFN